jgi:chromosome segregation ATPase
MAADGGGIIGTPGHSPALKYEIQLAELAKRRGMTPERIDLCFSVFDEILPQLGIFQRIAKMLKNELYNAVYSNEYTTGIGSRRSSGATSRVPFFIVAKKIMLERDKVVNKLKVQIESLKEQLYNCEADLEKVSSALETAKFDLRESDAKIHVMTIQNHQINEKNNQLQQKMSNYEDVQKESVEKGIMQRTELQESIKSLETQVEDLTPYKSTHLHIDEVFSLKRNEKTSPEELSIKV